MVGRWRRYSITRRLSEEAREVVIDRLWLVGRVCSDRGCLEGDFGFCSLHWCGEHGALEVLVVDLLRHCSLLAHKIDVKVTEIGLTSLHEFTVNEVLVWNDESRYLIRVKSIVWVIAVISIEANSLSVQILAWAFLNHVTVLALIPLLAIPCHEEFTSLWLASLWGPKSWTHHSRWNWRCHHSISLLFEL